MANPNPAVDSLVGRVIAGHRLVTELGSGGMGKVYYAEHLVIGRRAAIKILNPEVARDQTATQRFLTEARVVNEIQHPNVVEITDIGNEGGLHYIIMPLLEGETLGERLERVHTLDEAASLRIARQVSSALDAAHKRGIVHRDLKPENIFLTSHPDFPDYVKVLDFGVAKLKGPLSAGGPALTMAGTVVGTPFYMSPEQCRGSDDVDGRSDIYSMAVVMYQTLTGAPPFVSEQIMDVLIAHTNQVPMPAISANPSISPHINAAIMRGLEKDPANRFATMLEFREALENSKPPAAATPAAAAKDKDKDKEKEKDKEKDKEEDPRAKGIRGIADKLSEIIDARLQSDRLVVPTMPAIAIQCLEAIRNPKLSFKTVGAAIGKDPVLSSRVLKASNSAAFPGLTPVTTLEGAIARMGIEGLSAILVQYSVYQAFTSRDERIRQSFRGIWEHSLGVALVARELATRLTPSGPDANAAYLAGLLHDVGKPVVASLLLETEKAVTQGNKGAWFDEEIWRKIVNESHRKVGVLLAKRWNLPADVAVTIENCTAYDRNVPRACGNVVRLANALCKRAGLYVGTTSAVEVDQTIETGQVIMGLSADVTAAVSKDIYARVATMFEGTPPRVRTRSR